MITDKVCYVHLRNVDGYGNYHQTGGATIAWVVESETGNIVIGKPARCNVVDTFTKKEGRIISLDNLIFHTPQFVVKREALVALATAQAVKALGFQDLAPNAVEVLRSTASDMIEVNIESTMSSRWYEQIVRAHFSLFLDNTLDIAEEAISVTNFTI